MKKLEDIPKKQLFEAPEGYFDTLPGIVQARVAMKESAWAFGSWHPVLRYALPILVVALGLIWYLNAGQAETTEQLLASIDVVDIEEYLDESDMTTEELLDHIDYDQIQTDSLEFENSVIDFGDADIDDLLDNLDETEL